MLCGLGEHILGERAATLPQQADAIIHSVLPATSNLVH
jgi:hypothetical protein